MNWRVHARLGASYVSEVEQCDSELSLRCLGKTPPTSLDGGDVTKQPNHQEMNLSPKGMIHPRAFEMLGNRPGIRECSLLSVLIKCSPIRATFEMYFPYR